MKNVKLPANPVRTGQAWRGFPSMLFHPPTQETTALAVEECVTPEATIAATDLLCFGGFRTAADDPPRPWRRWVCILGTTGLPVELHL